MFSSRRRVFWRASVSVQIYVGVGSGPPRVAARSAFLWASAKRVMMSSILSIPRLHKNTNNVDYFGVR